MAKNAAAKEKKHDPMSSERAHQTFCLRESMFFCENTGQSSLWEGKGFQKTEFL